MYAVVSSSVSVSSAPLKIAWKRPSAYSDGRAELEIEPGAGVGAELGVGTRRSRPRSSSCCTARGRRSGTDGPPPRWGRRTPRSPCRRASGCGRRRSLSKPMPAVDGVHLEAERADGGLHPKRGLSGPPGGMDVGHAAGRNHRAGAKTEAQAGLRLRHLRAESQGKANRGTTHQRLHRVSLMRMAGDEAMYGRTEYVRPRGPQTTCQQTFQPRNTGVSRCAALGVSPLAADADDRASGLTRLRTADSALQRAMQLERGSATAYFSGP